MSPAGSPFDLIVIGGGPGGYVAAIRARQLGLRVGLVEAAEMGGVCLNWGCIPTKALLRNAEILEIVHHAKDWGIRIEGMSVDYSRAQARSRQASSRLRKGVEYLMKKNGITVFTGRGRITGKGEVTVSGSDGAPQTVTAAALIIATGARPRMLPGIDPGLIQSGLVMTSKEALELKELPGSIAILGAGAVGVEFAYLFRTYGVDVTLIEMLPRIVPSEDNEVSQELEKAFTGQGISIRTGTRVVELAARDGRVALKLASAGTAPTGSSPQVGGDLSEIVVDKVLVAVGIQPNTEDLGLEGMGVATERGFIKVDDQMRTSVPGIYAIGDVTGRLALAHVASAQGEVAAEAVARRPTTPLRYENLPRATYCHPQIASIGLTEAQARERAAEIKVGQFPFRANGKAIAASEWEGWVKVIADAASGEILGVHAIGAGVTEFLAEWGVAMNMEGTVEELGTTVHAHPTLSEAVREAALAALGQAVHI